MEHAVPHDDAARRPHRSDSRSQRAEQLAAEPEVGQGRREGGRRLPCPPTVSSIVPPYSPSPAAVAMAATRRARHQAAVTVGPSGRGRDAAAPVAAMRKAAPGPVIGLVGDDVHPQAECGAGRCLPGRRPTAVARSPQARTSCRAGRWRALPSPRPNPGSRRAMTLARPRNASTTARRPQRRPPAAVSRPNFSLKRRCPRSAMARSPSLMSPSADPVDNVQATGMACCGTVLRAAGSRIRPDGGPAGPARPSRPRRGAPALPRTRPREQGRRAASSPGQRPSRPVTGAM